MSGCPNGWAAGSEAEVADDAAEESVWAEEKPGTVEEEVERTERRIRNRIPGRRKRRRRRMRRRRGSGGFGIGFRGGGTGDGGG